VVSAGADEVRGFYVWYLVLAVKVLKREKRLKRESVELLDLV
jgi:hypothetical protein